MVKCIKDLVSTPEYHLFEAIRKVRFGEIYGVQVDDQAKWIDYELSPADLDFLLYLRKGAQYIDILTVHNGQPVLAETDFNLSGFRCRKKVKFPTVHTEG